MRNLLPIRKIACGLLATVLIAAARKAGLSLGNQDADQYANDLVGFAVAYLIPNPRVQKATQRLGLIAKIRVLSQMAEQAETQPPPVE